MVLLQVVECVSGSCHGGLHPVGWPRVCLRLCVCEPAARTVAHTACCARVLPSLLSVSRITCCALELLQESTCTPGCIHASDATHDLTPQEPWVGTGGIEVKGKGLMQTYTLGTSLPTIPPEPFTGAAAATNTGSIMTSAPVSTAPGAIDYVPSPLEDNISGRLAKTCRPQSRSNPVCVPGGTGSCHSQHHGAAANATLGLSLAGVATNTKTEFANVAAAPPRFLPPPPPMVSTRASARRHSVGNVPAK